MAWQLLAGAALGALAGSQPSRTTTSGTNTSTVQLQDINKLNVGRSDLEKITDQAQLTGFQDLQTLVNMGPGAEAIQADTQFQRQFGDFLSQMFQSGGVPTADQINQANQFAGQIFAPQRTAMQQAFQDQITQAQRLAARMGRPGTDPILLNKLAQEQTRQQAMLEAEQGAFAANFAQQLPQQQMNIGAMLSQLRGGLALQALQNRQMMLALGNQLTNSERQFRLATATRTGTNNQTQTGGGGLAGGIAGALTGAGAFTSLANFMQPTRSGGTGV